MSKLNKVELTVEYADHYKTVLRNNNGDTFTFDPQTQNGEALGDFISLSEVDNKCGVTPSELLQQNEELINILKTVINHSSDPWAVKISNQVLTIYTKP